MLDSSRLDPKKEKVGPTMELRNAILLLIITAVGALGAWHIAHIKDGHPHKVERHFDDAIFQIRKDIAENRLDIRRAQTDFQTMQNNSVRLSEKIEHFKTNLYQHRKSTEPKFKGH